MYCESLKYYKGSKSEIIQQMINDIERKKINDKFEELCKNKKVLEIVDKLQKVQEKKEIAEKKYNKDRAKLDEELNKFGLSYSMYNKELGVPYQCHVNEKTKQELHKANDLWFLGKKNEAKELWDKIIKEYNLIGD